jgi:hypothetical protein
LLRTWVVVTALWTVSDVLRLRDCQASILGWPVVLEDWGTWMGLLVPPLVLAAALTAIQLATGGLGRPWASPRDERTDQR